jgi:hypothetical protein
MVTGYKHTCKINIPIKNMVESRSKQMCSHEQHHRASKYNGMVTTINQYYMKKPNKMVNNYNNVMSAMK